MGPPLPSQFWSLGADLFISGRGAHGPPPQASFGPWGPIFNLGGRLSPKIRQMVPKLLANQKTLLLIPT